MNDVISIELYRNERWIPWETEALCYGDRFRALGGPHAGVVMRVNGELQDWGLPVIVEFH